MLQLLHMMDDWTLCLEKKVKLMLSTVISKRPLIFQNFIHIQLMKELSNGLSTFLKLKNIESELMAVTQAGII